MFTIKRTVLALALCVATVSVVYAQARRQDSTSTDAKLENLFPGTALAQKQEQAAVPDTNTAAAVIGPPVNCMARGYWSSSGDARLVLKSLNQTTGEAQIEGYDSNGISWARDSNRWWKFKNGILHYRTTRVRYRLVVGERALTGSYSDYNAPPLSRNKIVYQCDGPTRRVIIP